MKCMVLILTVSIFLCHGLTVEAAKGGKKGPSDRAYERANENAAFKRDKDWAPGEHKDKKKKKHHQNDDDHDDEDGEHKNKDKHKNKHKDDDHDDQEHPDDDHADDLDGEELLNETE